MAWFVGVLGLGMKRGIAQLDPRVIETEMVMIAAELVPEVAMTDAEQDSGLVMADEDKRVPGVAWSAIEVGARVAGLLVVGSTPGDETKVLSDELTSISTFKFSGGDGISVTCTPKKRLI